MYVCTVCIYVSMYVSSEVKNLLTYIPYVWYVMCMYVQYVCMYVINFFLN